VVAGGPRRVLGGFTVRYRADRAPRRWRRSPPSCIWSAHRVWVIERFPVIIYISADQTLSLSVSSRGFLGHCLVLSVSSGCPPILLSGRGRGIGGSQGWICLIQFLLLRALASGAEPKLHSPRGAAGGSFGFEDDTSSIVAGYYL
jgi:hypothetical protein